MAICPPLDQGKAPQLLAQFGAEDGAALFQTSIDGDFRVEKFGNGAVFLGFVCGLSESFIGCIWHSRFDIEVARRDCKAVSVFFESHGDFSFDLLRRNSGEAKIH